MHRHYSGTWLPLLITLLALQSCDEGVSPEIIEAEPVVGIVHAQVLPLISTVTLAGTLVPQQVAMVHAQTAGLVVLEILVEEGQMVTAGQMLARLSSERQIAELKGARGELVRAEQALTRAKVLKTSGTMAGSAADAATSSHVAALARVSALEIDLARASVRAPVAGFLQRRYIEIGETTNERPVFEIAAEGAIELVADLSETVWRQTRKGLGADIVLTDGRPLSGQIRRLSGALDSQTRLGRAWIDLHNPPDDLVSGTGATVRVRVGGADLLVVPQSSLLFDGQGAYVFVVTGGKAIRHEVTLGTQNSEYAEILKGVKAGDSVVARAGSLLRDGDPVRVALISSDKAMQP